MSGGVWQKTPVVVGEKALLYGFLLFWMCEHQWWSFSSWWRRAGSVEDPHAVTSSCNVWPWMEWEVAHQLRGAQGFAIFDAVPVVHQALGSRSAPIWWWAFHREAACCIVAVASVVPFYSCTTPRRMDVMSSGSRKACKSLLACRSICCAVTSAMYMTTAVIWGRGESGAGDGLKHASRPLRKE